jgi:ADP-ribose pyrophosphatase YjhB (NUDIX family)
MKTFYINDFLVNPEKVENSRWATSNGFCFNQKGEVCIVYEDEKGCWNLPGGGRENTETPLETFTREVREETQCEPINVKYFHAVRAKHTNEHGEEIAFENLNEEFQKSTRYCFRYICKLENILEFIPRKDGTEIDERKFVTLEELPKYIPWLTETENGRESFLKLKEILKIKNI